MKHNDRYEFESNMLSANANKNLLPTDNNDILTTIIDFYEKEQMNGSRESHRTSKKRI